MPIHLDNALTHSWARRKAGPVQGETKIMAAILAAGLGRRMEPFTTQHLPKPMFPLGGKIPMVEVWVDRLVRSGITDIKMNVCVLAETIISHFGSGARFGAHMQYVEEEQPTGTLGGICKQVLGQDAKPVNPEERMPAFPAFRGSTVIAPSGDIVTDFDAEMLEFMYDQHVRNGAVMSIMLCQVPASEVHRFGVAVLGKSKLVRGCMAKRVPQQGRITQFIEKDPAQARAAHTRLNNGSIYMIETELLKRIDPLRTRCDPHLPNAFYDFSKHLFPTLLHNLAYASLPGDFVFWGLEYRGEWFDVGVKRSLLAVNRALLDGKIGVSLPYQKHIWGYLGPNVSIDFNKAEIHPPVVIGENCVIEDYASLGPYAVIGDGWRVGARAQIRDSILWQRYPFFTAAGRRIPISERVRVDQHHIGRGVSVEQSIVTGGNITANLHEQIVSVLEDGTSEILSIDYVPEGPRA